VEIGEPPICPQSHEKALALTQQEPERVASTTLKIAVVAPMPNAIVRIAMVVNLGEWRRSHSLGHAVGEQLLQKLFVGGHGLEAVKLNFFFPLLVKIRWIQGFGLGEFVE
jgi:hypothetical protein